MARWYSKQRKARYSHEMRAYGCIPNYVQIVLGMRKPFGGLEKCDRDNLCDFCDRPSKGSYASMVYYAEDNPDCDFVICGRCAVRNYYQEAVDNQRAFANYSNFNEWKRSKLVNI